MCVNAKETGENLGGCVVGWQQEKSFMEIHVEPPDSPVITKNCIALQIANLARNNDSPMIYIYMNRMLVMVTC